MENLKIRDPQSICPSQRSSAPGVGEHIDEVTNERFGKKRIDKNLSRPSDSVFFLLPVPDPNNHPNINSSRTTPAEVFNPQDPRVQLTPSRIDPLTSPLMKGRSSVFTSQVCALISLLSRWCRLLCWYPAIASVPSSSRECPFFVDRSPQHPMAPKMHPIFLHHRFVSDLCPLSRANHVFATGLSLRSACPRIGLTHRLNTD